jgi:plastocyanin
MDARWFRKPAWLGLGLSATLTVAVAGCGGQGGESGDAMLVNSPDAKFTPKSSAAPTATATAPAGGGSTAGTVGGSTGGTATAPTTAAKVEGWGTLKGRVVYGGDPPQPKVEIAAGKAPKDPEVCAKSGPILSERLVVDTGTKGVKNAFVYLMRPSAVNEDAKKAVATAKVEFDQKNCTFIPHAMAVMAGATVTLKSSDPVPHNVNFQLRELKQNTVLSPGQSTALPVSNREPSPGQVTCNIHPWMSSYWMVLDHPYFAVTDDQGNFEIKNAPAGRQRVVVWQEAVGPVTKSSGDDVEIKANETTTREFTLDPAKIRPAG